jgi:hypothetical protein
MELCIHSYKKVYVHLVLQIKNSAFSITRERDLISIGYCNNHVAP